MHLDQVRQLSTTLSIFWQPEIDLGISPRSSANTVLLTGNVVDLKLLANAMEMANAIASRRSWKAMLKRTGDIVQHRSMPTSYRKQTFRGSDTNAEIVGVASGSECSVKIDLRVSHADLLLGVV